MKVKNKGKVYPPPPPPPSSKSSDKDPDSVLKLLPVTILALALSLPNQDREVLAYLIARSIFITTATNPCSLVTEHPKSKSKTKTAAPTTANKNEKYRGQEAPLFQCGCFDCYTGFWHRWDSSPNRDFIHQVIEAFDEHLVQNIECSKKHKRGKKKGKVLMMGHYEPDSIPEISVPEAESGEMVVRENLESGEIEENEVVSEEDIVECGKLTGNLEMEVTTVHASGYNNSHKGLARKVLPDIMGLLNSRLWSNLWSPGM